jgi:integrase
MKNYKVILWTHKTLINGEFSVFLRITKDRKVKYISLGISALPEQWDEQFGRYNEKKKKGILVHPDFVENNAFLNVQEIKAKDVINDFDRNKIDWTLNQFEEAFLNRSKKGKIKPFFANLIKTMRETDHNGNAECYERTLHMLELFDKKFDNKLFSEIDIKYVRAFDVFLQTPRETVYTSKKGNTRIVQRKGNSGNSRRIHFKTLRAVLNAAITENEASLSTYPFGKGGFQVAKLGEETEKRYLPSNQLAKVKAEPEIELKKSTLYAQKLFLFSYFCYGMSFKDMACLTLENIKNLENGSYIVYKRTKTRHNKDSKSISIKLTKELNTLVKELTEMKQPVDDYLLPIITVEGLSGLALYKHIKNRLKKFNGYLDAMAKELEIDNLHLTSYVSRHTMAMTLQNNNIPRELISQILDHKDMKTTNTYLDSFSSNIIDEAAKVL